MNMIKGNLIAFASQDVYIDCVKKKSGRLTVSACYRDAPVLQRISRFEHPAVDYVHIVLVAITSLPGPGSCHECIPILNQSLAQKDLRSQAYNARF